MGDWLVVASIPTTEPEMPAIFNLQSSIFNLQSAICNLQSAICNLQSAICNPQAASFAMTWQVLSSQFSESLLPFFKF
jgi:hypothetical protein